MDVLIALESVNEILPNQTQVSTQIMGKFVDLDQSLKQQIYQIVTLVKSKELRVIF